MITRFAENDRVPVRIDGEMAAAIRRLVSESLLSGVVDANALDRFSIAVDTIPAMVCE